MKPSRLERDTMTNELKLAAAPISWGVCETPGWGKQLDPERVLTDMKDLGITHTEFGPAGFLPEDAIERAEFLSERGMTAIGGFYPAVMHRDDHDPLPALREELEAYRAAGAEILVLSLDNGTSSYDDKRELTDEEWALTARRLNEAHELAASYGVRAVVHQHVGTLCESPVAVERLINDTEIELCLDTGHMLAGGNDPLAFVGEHADRVGHVHLKDVDSAQATKVLNGDIAYSDAVADGMYRPLGTGDAQIGAIIRTLREAGYDGWYVMEQDYRILDDSQIEQAVRDVQDSTAFVRSI
ncbi:TIM barrel protein [Helcobacillus massiliensis]